MRTDEILLRSRYSAHIGDGSAFSDYTDLWMLNECTDKLHTVFEDIVTKARAGYWLKETIITTSATKARYRIPYRSAAGGLEKVEIAQTSAGPWQLLQEIPSASTSRYETVSKGLPALYTVQGDQLDMMPAPDAAYALRLTYYLRPSRLVLQQSSTDNAGTVRGLITSIANLVSARQVTVNVLPFDMTLAVPAAMTNANLIDIVHPNGWHELSCVNAAQTSSGTVITIGGTDDLSDIEQGDYVRVAEQTDWPCLPDDYHRCLADMAAIKVLDELKAGSSEVATGVQADMIKFRSILAPRVKAEPPTVPVCLGGWSW